MKSPWARGWNSLLPRRSGATSGAELRSRFNTVIKERVRLRSVEPERILAVVAMRSHEYRVTIRAPRMDMQHLQDLTWEFRASLLSEPIGLQTQEMLLADTPLLPSWGQVVIRCGCPEQGDPCIMGEAVWFAVGARIERDPRTLLVFRGLQQGQLLGALLEEAPDTSIAVKFQDVTTVDPHVFWLGGSGINRNTAQEGAHGSPGDRPFGSRPPLTALHPPLPWEPAPDGCPPYPLLIARAYDIVGQRARRLLETGSPHPVAGSDESMGPDNSRDRRSDGNLRS